MSVEVCCSINSREYWYEKPGRVELGRVALHGQNFAPFICFPSATASHRFGARWAGNWNLFLNSGQTLSRRYATSSSSCWRKVSPPIHIYIQRDLCATVFIFPQCGLLSDWSKSQLSRPSVSFARRRPTRGKLVCFRSSLMGFPTCFPKKKKTRDLTKNFWIPVFCRSTS